MWSNEDPRFSGIYKSCNIMIYDAARNIVAMGSCETKHGFSVLTNFPHQGNKVVADSDIWPTTWYWTFIPEIT